MNAKSRLTPSQTIKVPTNRFLRHQYARQQSLTVMTFILGSQEYAIEFLKIQKTCRFDFVSQLTNAPSYIKGVINFQGKVLPIIDLRYRYSLASIESATYTEVIILNLANRLIGVAVDYIKEVTQTKYAKILNVPKRFSDIEARFLYGFVATDDRMVILVDIEKLVADKEMTIQRTLHHLVSERQVA